MVGAEVVSVVLSSVVGIEVVSVVGAEVVSVVGAEVVSRAVTTMRHLRQLPPRSNQVQCSVLFWPRSHALTTYLLFHMTAVLPNFGCCWRAS